MKNRRVRQDRDAHRLSYDLFWRQITGPVDLVAGLIYMTLKEFQLKKARTIEPTSPPDPVAAVVAPTPEPPKESWREVARRWLGDYATLQVQYPGLTAVELVEVLKPAAGEVDLRDYLRILLKDQAMAVIDIARRLELTCLWPNLAMTPANVEDILRTGGDFLWGTVGGVLYYRSRPQNVVERDVEGAHIDEFKLWLVERMGKQVMTAAEIKALPDRPLDHYAADNLESWLDGQTLAFKRLKSTVPAKYYVSIQGREWAHKARERMNAAIRPPLDPAGARPLLAEVDILIGHNHDLARSIYRVLAQRSSPLSIQRIGELLEDAQWLPPGGPVWTMIHGALVKNPRLFERREGKKNGLWALVNPPDRTLPPVEERIALLMGEDVLSAMEIKGRLRDHKDHAATFALSFLETVLNREVETFEKVGLDPVTGVPYYQVKGK